MEIEVKADDLPEFFKVYIPRDSSQKMSIPGAFVDYMGGKKSGPTELAGLSGQTWRVELVEDEEDMYISDGWQDFVNDNMIRDGDFLFFKYLGDLMFSVVIYDETMCEKAVVFVDNNKYSQGKDDVQEGGQVQDEVQPLKRIRAGRSKPDEEQKAAASTIPCSVNPSFAICMKRYNVDQGYLLNIPSWFILENSLKYKRKEKMVLRTKTGSSWAVNIIKSNNHYYSLCGGWAAFVRHNYIKEGDTCKFELVNRSEMKVYLAPRSKRGAGMKMNI